MISMGFRINREFGLNGNHLFKNSCSFWQFLASLYLETLETKLVGLFLKKIEKKMSISTKCQNPFPQNPRA